MVRRAVLHRVRQEIADLHPGYAALVMATGIVSTGLKLFGVDVLSTVLLVVAILSLGLLVVAYAWRAVFFPRRVMADVEDPARGFAYFTLVAAPNVVGMRLADEHPLTCAVLGLVSVPIWLVLTYVIPAAMVVGHRRQPVLPRTNGSWFMWVVGTQSLAAAIATVAVAEPSLTSSLAPWAVAFWGMAIVLYLMLVGLVAIRLLDAPVTPHALSPTYWVYMGATAISVLAGARILALPSTLPVLIATRHVVSGLSFVLWAFGTWWIPLLLALAVRRHVVERQRVGYEPALWSMVFPLGMYAAASTTYGRATGLTFMVDIARIEIWFGFAAWLAVAIAMCRSFGREGRAGLADTAPPGS
ncbi:tellurite resistance/C4-dicarboxylate transporter family protein [Streptomyces sp. gb1(2016)]|uniref:Tellurite resistance protein permease n=1 Tax=Streptomyces sp. gb1(2016) TaxID=1828321 RepID=A0A652L7R3_9ACTN|nr:tellurite resistance/C4-dicarboxylate transporter family protein [Streptomyces sp. gb1(2016)]TXS31198.1 tellurite resistance protein permease [Streptomyces sp. gb1(2016)]